MDPDLRELHGTETRNPNVIVRRELIPVEGCQLHLERGLVGAHVEQQFLVPNRIERVSDDASAEDLLAEGDDYKRVHVPTRTCHCRHRQHPRNKEKKKVDELFLIRGRSVALWISSITMPRISFSGLKLKSPFFRFPSFPFFCFPPLSTPGVLGVVVWLHERLNFPFFPPFPVPGVVGVLASVYPDDDERGGGSVIDISFPCFDFLGVSSTCGVEGIGVVGSLLTPAPEVALEFVLALLLAPGRRRILPIFCTGDDGGFAAVATRGESAEWNAGALLVMRIGGATGMGACIGGAT